MARRASCVRLAALLLPVWLTFEPQAQAVDGVLPNLEFKQGANGPSGWSLSGGKGRWIDRDVLDVTGDGKGSNRWQCERVRFTPGGLYRFEMRGRQIDGSGCVISGPEFANRDYPRLADAWQWYGHVFRVPDNVSTGAVRVGQWETKGTVQFDAVRLTPTIPVYRSAGKLLLGEGESIRDGRYQFDGSFGHEGSNFHRTLASATATFNSNRWCFSGDAQATYRFGLPGHPFTSAETGFSVNYHTAGVCLAEVSRDGKTWRTLTTQGRVGSARASLPADLFPADTLYLRLRADGPGSNFQVQGIELQGAVSGSPPDAVGQTLFADLKSPEVRDWVARISLCDDAAFGRLAIRAKLKQPAPSAGHVHWIGSVSRITEAPGRVVPNTALHRVRVDDGDGLDTSELAIPPLAQGRYEAELSLVLPDGRKLPAAIRITVPDYYRADYGEQIDLLSRESRPKSAAQFHTLETVVWWCDATHKVPRTRALPGKTGAAARLAAARNDYEAVQLVVRPVVPLKGLTATAGPLAGPGGTVIPAENIKVLRVYYHNVEHPTDGTGVRDAWPDALPPLKRPLDVAAGQNQPLWVLVYVPKDARAGDYAGAVSLRAEGWSANVPVRLHVWNFALPEKNHLETAFGFSPETAFQYHQVKTEADKRKLLDLYFRSFAEHRISPYNPTPLDHFDVRFLTDAKPPRVEIDFSRFDKAMAEAIAKYRFTGFSLPIHGMGGGTFFERYPPKIGPFDEKTPQYQALFASQVKQLEEHLKQKGWLGMAQWH